MPRAIATATVTIAALSVGGVWAADEPQPEKPATSIQTVTPQAAEAVLGGTIVDDAGKEIGRLVDVLVDRNGTPQAGVIDFGGFLGVGARKVAVHWGSLHFNPGDDKRLIVLDMTPDEIKAAPAYGNPDKPAPVVTRAAAVPRVAPPLAAAPEAANPEPPDSPDQRPR